MYSSKRDTIIQALVLALTATSVTAQEPNTFKYVGLSGVSAQQLFLGTRNKVYIVDKTENNNLTVNGHPAWASEYDLTTNDVRPMDVVSNSFCAGGTVLGNGTWLNVGGNQAITYGGQTAANQAGNTPYGNTDGGKAIRFLDPCDDGTCNWLDDEAMYMTSRRWYPTLETLEDGSAIIFGGCEWGGYVNGAVESLGQYPQNNPTVEYWPSKGIPFTLRFLLNTMPVNLFPLVFLLPSGNMLIQAEFKAMIFDYKNTLEYNIDDIPDAVRVYPASAATTVLPMTPNNNWTATVIFCGGTNLASDQWRPDLRSIVDLPTETSCVTISPDVDLAWYQNDPLPAGRSMGQFINLPDGRLFLVNGAGKGTAGYGNDSWAIGQSYADDPQLQSWYFDPTQPAGSRWSQAAASTIPRMYHSSATLLADGSVFISGSNPNADYVSEDNLPNSNYKYLTQYQVEIFYPDYWGKTRPNPSGMPDRIIYGGASFDIELTLADLDNNALNINSTKAVIIRTGFSTHAMNMGQRYVELRTSFTGKDDGSATLHVAQLPPNPAILVPGPALFFIVVNGVPSEASWIMVGNGQIGTQPTDSESVLPNSTISAQMVAQYGSTVSRRDSVEEMISKGWRWVSKWALLWDWE